MEQVSQERLQQEIGSAYKPLALSSGLSELPYCDLSDRDFENLIYSLLRAEIDVKEYWRFDEISLMQGVGERGRDCVLYSGGLVSGVVQCKKLKGRMSRPDVIREASKFILFSLLDKELLPDGVLFEYHLYASSGFSEPAVKLLYDFSKEIEVEMKSGALAGYLSEVISSFESFKCFEACPPVLQVFELLGQIRFRSYDSTNLNARLHQKSSVLSSFFQVRLVVESQPLLEQLDQKWNAAGLNFLTDEALRSLHERLSTIEDNLKVGLGALDLYGYSMGFMKHLGAGGFAEALKKAVDLSGFLDKKLMDYLSVKISDALYNDITIPFVHSGIILPFTVNVVNQYAVRCVLPKIQLESLTPGLLDMMYPDYKLEGDDFLKSILNHNLESQRMVAAGDYSRLPNPDPDREYRLFIFESLRGGVDVSQLEARFWVDFAKIRRSVESIVNEVSSEFSPLRTLIVKDYAFMKNRQEARRVMETVMGIGNGGVSA